MATLSNIHPDILHSHIFPKLDGPSLSAVSSSSSELRSLCTGDNQLWKHICQSTWPSLNHPLVSQVISTFPSGHRSFYHDSFPIPHPTPLPSGLMVNKDRPSGNTELISVVDIRYQDKLVYSKVEVTNTATESFLSTPLRIELVDPNLTGQPGFCRVNFEEREKEFLAEVEESVTLNWIFIDPTTKRTGNFSSVRPILAQRNWLTNEVQLQFATTLSGEGSAELVQCRIDVTCEGKEGEELHVREVTMKLHDMNSKCLTGEECLVILGKALEGGRRKLGNRGEEKVNYEEFLKMRRERRETRERKETRKAKVNRTIQLSIFVVLLVCVSELLFY